MNSMTAALRRYADFEGRSSRTEYWMFILFQLVLMIGAGLIFSVMTTITVLADPDGHNALTGIVSGLFGLIILAGMLYLFVPSLAVTVRRLHDTGNSGWLMLLQLVPLGGFVIFVFTVLESSPGSNRYGRNPHEPAAASAAATVFD